jgi:hypothetical protein
MKATTQAILSELAHANKGAIAGLSISEDLYPEESVQAAAAAYSRYCRVDWTRHGDGQLRLSVSLLPGAGVDRTVIGEFLNYLLNHAIHSRWRRDGVHD